MMLRKRPPPPERIDPATEVSGIVAHHLAKYEFASAHGANATVLDIGCGLGYGTAFLAQNVALAVGGDVALDPISHARARYGGSGARFVCMNAMSIGFADAVFDLITCFEVLEHLVDPDRHLAEAARVLKPNGTYVVSTPQPGWGGSPEINEFHEHEFTRDELLSLLKNHFQHVDLLGQRRLDTDASRALRRLDVAGIRQLAFVRPVARRIVRWLGSRATEDALVSDFAIDEQGSYEGSEFVAVCRPGDGTNHR